MRQPTFADDSTAQLRQPAHSLTVRQLVGRTTVAAYRRALARFAPANRQLPLRFPQDPDRSSSPKPSYCLPCRYLGPAGLDDPQTLATYSNFDVAVSAIPPRGATASRKDWI